MQRAFGKVSPVRLGGWVRRRGLRRVGYERWWPSGVFRGTVLSLHGIWENEERHVRIRRFNVRKLGIAVTIVKMRETAYRTSKSCLLNDLHPRTRSYVEVRTTHLRIRYNIQYNLHVYRSSERWH